MATKKRRRAAIAGATGLVGHELTRELLDTGNTEVHLLVRRALGDVDRRAVVHVVDFARFDALPPLDDLYCALGTTIKVAGSEEAFRRIDFDAVVAVARAARASGATRLAVVSALGADATSRVFYNRVKGQMEAAVSELGFDSVVIARPSLLTGDREALGQPTRLGERVAIAFTAPLRAILPAGVRPIEARVVARAMVHALASAAAGVTVLDSAQLQSLGATS